MGLVHGPGARPDVAQVVMHGCSTRMAACSTRGSWLYLLACDMLACTMLACMQVEPPQAANWVFKYAYAEDLIPLASDAALSDIMQQFLAVTAAAKDEAAVAARCKLYITDTASAGPQPGTLSMPYPSLTSERFSDEQPQMPRAPSLTAAAAAAVAGSLNRTATGTAASPSAPANQPVLYTPFACLQTPAATSHQPAPARLSSPTGSTPMGRSGMFDAQGGDGSGQLPSAGRGSMEEGRVSQQGLPRRLSQQQLSQQQHHPLLLLQQQQHPQLPPLQQVSTQISHRGSGHAASQQLLQHVHSQGHLQVTTGLVPPRPSSQPNFGAGSGYGAPELSICVVPHASSAPPITSPFNQVQIKSVLSVRGPDGAPIPQLGRVPSRSSSGGGANAADGLQQHASAKPPHAALAQDLKPLGGACMPHEGFGAGDRSGPPGPGVLPNGNAPLLQPFLLQAVGDRGQATVASSAAGGYPQQQQQPQLQFPGNMDFSLLTGRQETRTRYVDGECMDDLIAAHMSSATSSCAASCSSTCQHMNVLVGTSVPSVNGTSCALLDLLHMLVLS